MARNRRRSRSYSLGPARRTLSNTSLGHTAGPSLDFEPMHRLPRTRQAFSSSVRSPLIRTVLIDSRYQPRPQRGRPNSPVAPARATGRSSDRQTRSPFLNATLLTPELTERALICARRGIRREVLFASKRTGKGAKSPKRKFSKVRC